MAVKLCQISRGMNISGSSINVGHKETEIVSIIPNEDRAFPEYYLNVFLLIYIDLDEQTEKYIRGYVDEETGEFVRRKYRIRLNVLPPDMSFAIKMLRNYGQFTTPTDGTPVGDRRGLQSISTIPLVAIEEVLQYD